MIALLIALIVGVVVGKRIGRKMVRAKIAAPILKEKDPQRLREMAEFMSEMERYFKMKELQALKEELGETDDEQDEVEIIPPAKGRITPLKPKKPESKATGDGLIDFIVKRMERRNA